MSAAPLDAPSTTQTARFPTKEEFVEALYSLANYALENAEFVTEHLFAKPILNPAPPGPEKLMYIAHLLPGFKGAQSASGSSKTGGGSEAPDPPRVEVQRAAV